MTDWVTIAGGPYVVGLTETDVAALASASAAAARRRVDEDPDTELADWSALDRTTGNPEYLARLLAAALPAREIVMAPFAVRRTPVTNGEYAEFMRVAGARVPDGWSMGTDAPDRPVIGVSWEEAVGFAEWAGMVLPGHHRVDLPDEDQWERAARGVGRRLFPWGNDWGDPGAWLDRQRFYDPWAAIAHPELASSDRVLAMVTGRWEWTASRFDLRNGDRDALAELYPGHDDGGQVRRGGSGSCLVACAVARMGSDPSWQADGTGFRLVRPA